MITKKHAITAAKWLLDHFDTLLSLAAGIILAALGLKSKLDSNQLQAAMLALLSILSFVLLRAQTARHSLRESIARLTTELRNASTNADQVFTRELEEKQIIRRARTNVTLVQETGTLLAERAKDELVALLIGGGQVRATFVLPTAPILRLLAFRNANLDHAGLLQRSQMCIKHIEDLATRAGDAARNLTIRFVPYSIGATITLGDSQSPIPEQRVGIVRYSDFRVAFQSKLDMMLDYSKAPTTYTHYVNQCHLIHQHATKWVLLTGAPRVGKTSMLSRLIAFIKEDPTSSCNAFWIRCPEILEGGERVGFRIECSESNQSTIMAKRSSLGGYDYVEDSLLEVMRHLSVAHSKRRIIIIDEIGPIQFRQSGYADLLKSIISDPASTVFASIAEPGAQSGPDQALLKYFINHYRTVTVELTRANQDKVWADLQDELNASVAMITEVDAEFLN